MNIIQAMSDKKLFAPWFKDQATWAAWRAFLAVLFNLPMDDEQQVIARACTGLETLPDAAFTEAWVCVGRRGGKSLILAMIVISGAFQRLEREPGAWRARHGAGVGGRSAAGAEHHEVCDGVVTEVPLLAGRVARATTEE